MTYIDANIFIRFLVPGDATKGADCRALFSRIDAGQLRATTTEAVVAEIVYVLASTRGAAYGVTRPDITARLRPLLALPGLVIPDKAAVLHALDLFETYSFLDFADALAIAHTMKQQLESITSYDRDFDRIDGVQRVEPEPADRRSAA